MKNLTLFTGNLTRDVEITRTSSGMAIANIGLALNEGWGDRQKVLYPRLKAFGEVAERMEKLCKKGSRVSVLCRYDENKWDDKTTGEKRMAVEFIIDKWEFAGGGKKEEGDGDSEEAPTPSSPSPKLKASSPKPKPSPKPPVEDDDDDIPF